MSSDGNASDAKHHVEPLAFNVAPDRAWAAAHQAALELGLARIVEERDGYVWIEVSTRWLGFVDDLELRLDAPARCVHARSASRVGYSDFGVNRRRIDALRARFHEQLARR